MYTDWLLIRRLAWELERRLRGGRIRDFGQLGDGRYALAVWKSGHTHLVCIDAFAPTPVVTIEDGDLPIAAEPGFVRAAGAALRGTTLTAVRARKGDRLLRFDVAARSRFGVQDGYSLICELVPRFGNVILIKGDTIVAAAKEFAPAQNRVRTAQAGDPYEPPPLPANRGSRLLEPDVAAALAEREPDGDLYVYRRDGKLAQAHLAPLPQFAEDSCERSSSLLDLLAEARRDHAQASESDRGAKRRRALERSLRDRAAKLEAELHQAVQRSSDVQAREQWREQGEAIYATLHELAPDAQAAEKERAAELFARYRKAGAAAEHLARRIAELRQALDDLEQLRWELERAPDTSLDELQAAIDPPHAKSGRIRRQPERRRKPLQYATRAGSRIFVGRTPSENAELTFRTARPDDLWFHVQNQPGAHVILQRDDHAPAPEQDVLTAAALAAFHSKAKTSPKVTVDYTPRKFVRKRPSAAPGLVFYTNPKSVVVIPAEPAEQP